MTGVKACVNVRSFIEKGAVKLWSECDKRKTYTKIPMRVFVVKENLASNFTTGHYFVILKCNNLVAFDN